MMRRFFFVIFVTLLSCNPPRDNPYDRPVVYGEVKNITGLQPIKGAYVRVLSHKNIATVSDTDGYYEIYLGHGVYRLVAEKNGYEPDTSDTIEITTKGATRLDFYLNALPVFETTRVRTFYDIISGPLPVYKLCYYILVEDPDGLEIESTWVFLPEPISDTIFVSKNDLGEWKEVPISFDALYSIRGKPIYAEACDKNGGRTISDAFWFTNVFTSAPVLISPASEETLDIDTLSHKEFIWHNLKTDFDVFYKVEILGYVLSDSTQDTFISFYRVIDSEKVQSGVYYWRVYAKDSEGNFTYSEAHKFYIQ